jgi:dethiobiotin synthetase
MERREDNLATLRHALPAPCLGVLPHGIAPAQAARGGVLKQAVQALRGHP